MLKLRPCPPMPASGFMIARDVRRFSNQIRAIAASIAHTARCPARPFKAVTAAAIKQNAEPPLDPPPTGRSIYCIPLYAFAYTSVPTNCSKYDMALGRKQLGRTKKTTLLWQRVLHALLIFGLLLGTGVISDGVVAQGHHSTAPMGQHDGPMPDDNPVNGHSLVNCCTFSCSPSFTRDPENTGAEIRLSVRLATPIIQDTPPRSIYLENEPPVPRPNFSQI